MAASSQRARLASLWRVSTVPLRIPGNEVLVGWAGPAVGNPGDVKDNALELDPTPSGRPGPPFMQPEHLCGLQVTALSWQRPK